MKYYTGFLMLLCLAAMACLAIYAGCTASLSPFKACVCGLLAVSFGFAGYVCACVLSKQEQI